MNGTEVNGEVSTHSPRQGLGGGGVEKATPTTHAPSKILGAPTPGSDFSSPPPPPFIVIDEVAELAPDFWTRLVPEKLAQVPPGTEVIRIEQRTPDAIQSYFRTPMFSGGMGTQR